eukprot:CAMPEP_0181085646 /NCGR_PEP_ID=MMETSP1071-20121207/5337_1 /TAXON_ID=35127 /ORGANISM="Thalassiosira sp., Strain NH16" /LENGTH=465 /DNA_ID=CAMNT_0023167455 /DNA_START=554 /DNA_END=1951 /DNA_ORIENTATION=-
MAAAGDSTRRYPSYGGHTSLSSMIPPSACHAPAPLLNGPVPGSTDDPATMSKTDAPPNIGDDDHDNDDPDTAAMMQFVRLLRTRHEPPLDMVEMDGDGNCLFRAVSLQVYGDPSMHAEARARCMDFMEREADHFRDFVAYEEEYGEYVARKRLDGVHGNHAEIQAMSELYNRTIEVFVPSHGIEPINIFHVHYKGNDAPIRLCYMDGNHYNAVVDPLLPTAGLGLGLPGLQPGLADRLQLEQAKNISDDSAMEEKMRCAMEESNRASEKREAMEMEEALRKSGEADNGGGGGGGLGNAAEDMYKKKAMYLSEMEAADFDLEQAVLASSLESYQKAEQERKPPSSSRRGEGRRSRFNSSPRGHRSSSNSPVHRANVAAAAAGPSSNQYAAVAAAAASSSSSSLPGAYAQASSAVAGRNDEPADEYPASVQELVMNGFELSRVLHAYDLIGDNFDDLLSFLLSSSAT